MVSTVRFYQFLQEQVMNLFRINSIISIIISRAAGIILSNLLLSFTGEKRIYRFQ
jgi:hypothetical protein